MGSESLIIGVLALGLLLFGCATSGVALPEAKSGQPYAYTIALPQNPGTPPFACSAASGSALPGTLSFSGCTLTGKAPILSETASEGVFSFGFMVTDADGKSAGPFQATLPVTRGPPVFTPPEPWDVATGFEYIYNFCDDPSAFDCRYSSSVDGGVPPYTFSATGLPLGLFMKSNGELSGTVPDATPDGKKEFQVCVTDSAKLETCETVALTVGCDSPYEGTWTGTVTEKGKRSYYKRPAADPRDEYDYVSDEPYELSYSLTLTLRCHYHNEPNEEFPGEDYGHKIDYAEASHPFLECTDGCKPINTGEWGEVSYFNMPPPGEPGYFSLVLQLTKSTDIGVSGRIPVPAGPYDWAFSSDGNRIVMSREGWFAGDLGTWAVIDSIQEEVSDVESLDEEKIEGCSGCTDISASPEYGEIVLTKVS